MNDKIVESMVEASTNIIRRFGEGHVLSPDELKFIVLTKKLTSPKKENPINSILEGVKPVIPLISSLFNL